MDCPACACTACLCVISRCLHPAFFCPLPRPCIALTASPSHLSRCLICYGLDPLLCPYISLAAVPLHFRCCFTFLFLLLLHALQSPRFDALALTPSLFFPHRSFRFGPLRGGGSVGTLSAASSRCSSALPPRGSRLLRPCTFISCFDFALDCCCTSLAASTPHFTR